MAFELGQTYSGYHFLDVVKRGRNGVEFRVENTCAERMEILRTLPQSAQDDPERGSRFMRELRVRARLLHPNIVMMFNAFELEQQLVMTTEVVEGSTLAERLEHGAIPWREAMGLMHQALAAIGFAHEQKVVHRDINPENVVVTPQGVLKLANFALAKSAASPRLTQVGAVIGNLKYISPEQVKGIDDADARSDLYSLGIVLYEMLSGRVPFDCASQFELMAAHVSQAPLPPSQRNPDVPKELDAVVLKAIAKDPAARYQTAAEFEQALKFVKAGQPVLPAARALAPVPVPVFAAPPRSSAPTWLVYGGAACFGVLLMVVWFAVK